MIAKIRDLFTNKFPRAECTIPDPREKGILLSPHKYFVLLENSKWEDQWEIRILQPYICRWKRKILYGWTDGQNIFDSRERSIHLDDNAVVGIGDRAGSK